MPHISPTHFADRMASHWSDLGNVPSPALKQVWAQMALAFGKHVLDDDNCIDRSRWTVLQPPTGTGKTMGTALYAAMLAQLVQQGIHPGVLILKTMTADVDDLTAKINELAGLDGYAVAMHSALPTKPDPEVVQRAPVLCTTHAAYRLAAGSLGLGSDETASPLLGWQGGSRKLVVIDECLEPVHVHSVSASEVEHLKADIPPTLRDKYPAALDWLESLIALVDDARSTPGGRVHKWVDAALKGDARAELKALRPALKAHLEQERRLLGIDRSAAIKRTDDVLPWLLDMSREPVLYTPKGARDELTAAAFALPEGIKGAVVLDATASTNGLYRHYDRAQVLPAPRGTRTYANVTVHFSTGHAVGKTTMTEDPMHLLQPALEDLSRRLSGRKALLITHKACETSLKLLSTPGLEIELTHWGAVTGSNAWRDLNAVVILGLPQRPNHWATAALLKLKDRTHDEKELRDMKRELVMGQTISDLIQGINRVRCRKVVDERGNCEPCDVYLALGSEKDAEEILRALSEQMPGIRAKEWPIRPTLLRQGGRPPEQARRATDAVIHAFYANATESLDRSQALVRIPGLKEKGWEAMARAAKDDDSYTVKALEEAGLVFCSPGPGKRATVMRAT